MLPRSEILAVAVILVAVAGAYMAMPSSEREAPPPPRHVILVSIDTLRADHLGAYGHPRAVTPHLDALASRSVVFDRHISTAPTTLASHTALFTGNHPHTHGAPRNDYVVSDDNLMLQEVLTDNGYQTAAFLGAIPLASHSNFTQGFDHLDEAFSMHRKVDGVAQTMRGGEEVTDAVLKWVGARDDERPLFLFAHYFDVHSPYQPPAEHLAHYAPDTSIKNAGSMGHISRTRAMLRKGAPAGKKHSNALKELYLGGVTHADAEVGRLLDGLDAAGILDDALVVITSDHGETFDTHEELWNHGETVFDETVHTPLIVGFPDGWGAGMRIPTVVSNVDVMPTILELLNLPSLWSSDGESMVPLLRGDRWATRRAPAYSEGTKPHVRDQAGWQNAPMQKSVRNDRHKLILDPKKDQMRLFDLADDPGELSDIAESNPGVVRNLRDQLDTWRWSASPLPSERQSSGRVKAELAALGYVDDEPEKEAAAED